MIPRDKITKEHVLAAIADIERDGVPEMRRAKGFDLIINGKTYPPKYVLSMAAKHATGNELAANEFSGGAPTNDVLTALGFEIIAREQQSLRDGLERVMERYVMARTTEPFGKQHELWKTFSDVRQSIRQLDPIRENSHIRVDSSVGQGNWTKVPWIALLDDRETDTTQHGVYAVFLFRQDMTGVYLTLAQGVTEPRKKLGAQAAREFLRSTATETRARIPDLGNAGFTLDDDVDLKPDTQLGSDYQDSVIAYKLYEKGKVPDDDSLEADVGVLMNAYQKYIDTKSITGDAVRHWIFQANPQSYDLSGALKVLESQSWLVSQHKTEIQKGDAVYLWEAGPNAGIVAKGTISTEPTEMLSKDDENPFILKPEKFAGPQLRVLIEIDQVLARRLTRRELMQDDILKFLTVIRFANATNFRVTPQQVSRIEELISMQESIQATGSPLAELQKRTFLSLADINLIEDLLIDKKQVVFEGPPGSGKTYVAKLFARHFAGLPLTGGAGQQVRIVQFHQSYGYEDFIEGIRPETKAGHIEYSVLPGIFKRVCADARSNPEKKFIVIIDEINRGNISRIFGELLLLLEYRDLEIELLYQKEGETFSIGHNVFIIGTMNTTDRSLAQIDYALRRRFYFYRLMPVVGDTAPVLEGWLAAQGEFTPAERDEVLRLFLNLNVRVRQELGEHFQIGHSYFMKPGIRTSGGRQQIWNHAVLPLLEEYFYNRRKREELLTEFTIEKLLTPKAASGGA